MFVLWSASFGLPRLPLPPRMHEPRMSKGVRARHPVRQTFPRQAPTSRRGGQTMEERYAKSGLTQDLNCHSFPPEVDLDFEGDEDGGW
jgi:hypothetical protein